MKKLHDKSKQELSTYNFNDHFTVYARTVNTEIFTNLRHVVQRWPAVPTAANKIERTARLMSASSITTMALFPLNSSKHLPNLLLTVCCTIKPTYIHGDAGVMDDVLIVTYLKKHKTPKTTRIWAKINTFELPVNETRGIRGSLAIAWPISAPPQNEVNIAPGKLFFSRTSATSFVTAIVTNGVVGAPFLQYISPSAED